MTGKDIKVLKLSSILFFFFFFCPEVKVLHKWKGKSKTEGPSGPTQDCERRWAPGLPHPNPVWMRTTWSQWAPRGGQAEETLGWALLASWGSLWLGREAERVHRLGKRRISLAGVTMWRTERPWADGPAQFISGRLWDPAAEAGPG